MTMVFSPIFVLPNIPLTSAIGCEIAALVPADDDRVAAIKRAQPRFAQFMQRFSDNFGESFEPSVLLVRDDAPPAFQEISALASFRDLIALSAICHSRALELRQRRGHRVMFGEAFAFYPWMLDRHYEDMIGSTPALLGSHDLSLFQGQASPALLRTALSDYDIDQPLLAALMACWQRRYTAAEPDWADRALMRSLNMAYQATLLPAGADTTVYDVGRIISLWVSAFEILVHPGANGQANISKVFGLLERTSWLKSVSGAPVHETGKTKTKRPLASWLYQALYDCRNDFLHGNPVDRATLILPVSGRTLFEFAAPLYRLALTAFLPLSFDRPMPRDDAVALGEYIAERMSFNGPQKRAEEAILVAGQAPAPAPPHVRVTRPATPLIDLPVGLPDLNAASRPCCARAGYEVRIHGLRQRRKRSACRE